MDTKLLKTFITVSSLLNFRAASEELNYSQSTVSDHIHCLEEELNVKLFERLGRKVFLTKEGMELIEPAKTMIKNCDEIYRLFENTENIKGTLNIGSAETICASWLPPILKEYKSLYPNVNISLKMADCSEFPELLDKNIIDAAFSLHHESNGTQFSEIYLFQIPTLFVCSKDHPLTKFKKINPSHLIDESLILAESKSGYSFELIQALKDKNIFLNNVMEFNSVAAIKECVKNGLGITLLPEIIVKKEIEAGELSTLNVDLNPITITAKMIYHKEKWMSPALSALIELLSNKIYTL